MFQAIRRTIVNKSTDTPLPLRIQIGGELLELLAFQDFVPPPPTIVGYYVMKIHTWVFFFSRCFSQKPFIF